MLEIEAVAVEGCGRGIVQYRLVRKFNAEDISQDCCCFPGRDGEGHVESEDKAEDVFGVMDLGQINHRSIRG